MTQYLLAVGKARPLVFDADFDERPAFKRPAAEAYDYQQLTEPEFQALRQSGIADREEAAIRYGVGPHRATLLFEVERSEEPFLSIRFAGQWTVGAPVRVATVGSQKFLKTSPDDVREGDSADLAPPS